MDKTRQ